MHRNARKYKNLKKKDISPKDFVYVDWMHESVRFKKCTKVHSPKMNEMSSNNDYVEIVWMYDDARKYTMLKLEKSEENAHTGYLLQRVDDPFSS